ncbi:MAG TPA: GTPase [Micromonosporaceae bacterium]
MTGMIGKIHDVLRPDRGPDVDRLLARIDALTRLLDAAENHLPAERLVAARTVVERAGARLARSRDHTVVALAGATGSGKSSLFNALARQELSPVGVLRPTTGVTHAGVWGPPAGAAELLDWIGVPPRHRFIAGGDEPDEALRGLVLLDLPDFDSIERTHRAEVNRLLGLVDLVVWVLDPQKYADRLVHRNYLREFGRHKDVTVIVFNQADVLGRTELSRVLDDLRHLLAGDGLADVPLLATSTLEPASVDPLRTVLERAVAGRQAALRRLAADLDVVGDDLAGLLDAAPPGTQVDSATTRRLVDALAASAGVPVVVEAVERAYRHRAALHTGWPLVRGLRRLRVDPLRRLHLSDADRPADPAASVVAATSVPAPNPAQRSAAALAVRSVADEAGAGLPGPWRDAVGSAATSRLDRLPDALDRVLATTDLGLDRPRRWWRLVQLTQSLIIAAASVGLGWLVVGYLVRVLGLPPMEYPMVGRVPLPTLLLLGGLPAGLLAALLVRPIVSVGARRARRRAEQRLRAAVADVGQEHVLAPVHEVLSHYATAWEALGQLRSGR